jgi:sulfur carrier protein
MDTLALSGPIRLKKNGSAGRMRVKVQILAGTEDERILEVADDATYELLVGMLAINPEEVIVLRNGQPVPEDERLSEQGGASPAITVIRIVSSG